MKGGGGRRVTGLRSTAVTRTLRPSRSRSQALATASSAVSRKLGDFAVNGGQPGLEFDFVAAKRGPQQPVGGGPEIPDGVLAVDDHAQGHGLNAARAAGAADGPGNELGDFEAGKAVFHTAGLLGVDQIAVYLRGMGQGVQYGALGHLVVPDAAKRMLSGHVFEDLVEVPGNGFALAVRVAGQIDGTAFGRGTAEVGDDLLLILRDDVLRGEPFLNVDAKLKFRQIADVADRGQDDGVFVDVGCDFLRLGRRFDDDQ